MPNAFSASDSIQKKVLYLFDKFIETSIIGNDCLITNKKECFNFENLNNCKDNYKQILANKQENTSVKDAFLNNAKDEKLKHIYYNIDWLYTMPDIKEGKPDIKEEELITEIGNDKVYPFFKQGIASYGQSVSSGKNDAIFLFMSIIADVKKNITEGNIEDVKGQIIKLLNNYTDSKYEHGKKILRYLCSPVKFSDYNNTIDEKFFPIMSSNDTTITKELKIENKERNVQFIAKWLYNKLNLSSQKKKDKEQKILEEINQCTDWKNPFYSPYVLPFWQKDKTENFTEMNALKFKKALILYGPPGTSKTYKAKQMAAELLRSDFSFEDYFKYIVKKEKDISNRIHRLQLHANYTYEDFVWGYQIDSNGESKAKKGYFLRLLDEVCKDDNGNNVSKPTKKHVLILDEINRIDLSRLFGELFSAIENRNETVDLQQEVEGTKSVCIPGNLYIIGTMNEIDFSLERIDFALRRRFTWFFYGYNEDILRSMLYFRLNSIDDNEAKNIESFINSCSKLNNKIKEYEPLGVQYQIGHTIFADVINIKEQVESCSYNTAKKILWNISIKPMLEAFLGNLDMDELKRQLNNEKDSDTLVGTFFKSKQNGEDI